MRRRHSSLGYQSPLATSGRWITLGATPEEDQRAMDARRLEAAVAWLTLGWGLLYGVSSTVTHLRMGLPPLTFADELIATALLLYAAWRALLGRHGAAGLVFGAWAFTFCGLLMSYEWRATSESLNAVQERNLAILKWTLPLVGAVFLASFGLLHGRGDRAGGAQGQSAAETAR